MGNNGGATRSWDRIVGDDPGFRTVLARAARVAPTRAPVLVTGESGTGKELVAEMIHNGGPAPTGPYVAVNCGTLPHELADSELFGHERGAFTGAGRRKTGWFEEANGGTLVLDEIGELPLGLQPKLLRVLETGRVRRVGGSGEIAVSVRVVALTLRDVRLEVQRGAFRTDLYHRLAGFELAVPPLRQRRGDIPRLVEHFLRELASEFGPRTVEREAARILAEYDWPGNVRELRNVLRRAAILSGALITVDALGLPAAVTPPTAQTAQGTEGGMMMRGDVEGVRSWRQFVRLADGDEPLAGVPAAATHADSLPEDVLALTGRTFPEIECEVLGWALRRHGGSRRKAARALGIPRSSFCDKVKKYGLAS